MVAWPPHLIFLFPKLRLRAQISTHVAVFAGLDIWSLGSSSELRLLDRLGNRILNSVIYSRAPKPCELVHIPDVLDNCEKNDLSVEINFFLISFVLSLRYCAHTQWAITTNVTSEVLRSGAMFPWFAAEITNNFRWSSKKYQIFKIQNLWNPKLNSKNLKNAHWKYI